MGDKLAFAQSARLARPTRRRESRRPTGVVTTRREAEVRQDERIRSNSQIGSGDEKEKGLFLSASAGVLSFRLVTPFTLAAAVIRVECRQRGPTPCALSIRSLRRAARVFDSPPTIPFKNQDTARLMASRERLARERQLGRFRERAFAVLTSGASCAASALLCL